jgi:hypothetical protein
MNLSTRVLAVLGAAFVEWSGIGILDDASTRLFKASLLLAAWLSAMAFCILCAFSDWVVDLWPFYWSVWPFKESDPKTAMLGAFLLLGIPSFAVATSVKNEFASFAREKASAVQALRAAGVYVLVGLSVPVNRTQYGSLCALIFHGVLVFWFVRKSKAFERSSVNR